MLGDADVAQQGIGELGQPVAHLAVGCGCPNAVHDLRGALQQGLCEGWGIPTGDIMRARCDGGVRSRAHGHIPSMVQNASAEVGSGPKRSCL
jgi:hypothetical protein